MVEALNPKVMLALTATATEEVVNDVRDVLGMEGAALFLSCKRRSNLKLSSSKVSLTELFGKIEEKVNSIGGSVIVYANTRDLVERLQVYLYGKVGEVVAYHSQLPEAVKKNAMQDFMAGRARVIVATNAFGAGGGQTRRARRYPRHTPCQPGGRGTGGGTCIARRRAGNLPHVLLQ